MTAPVPNDLILTDDTILNCLLKAFKPNSAVVSLLLTERWKDGIEIETPTHGLQDFAVDLVRPYEDRIAQLEATIRKKDERIARLEAAIRDYEQGTAIIRRVNNDILAKALAALEKENP